ncbi:MAG: oligosaccharide flippase family protein [Armatimonas sp.]
MESPQKRSLGRLALAVLSTNVAVLAMNFLTGIIISRTLGVDGRGRLATLQLWPMLISTTLSGGFNAAAIHFTAKNLGDKPRYVGGIIVLSLLIGLITMGLGIPMALYELPLRQTDLHILLVAFFTIPIGVTAELTSAAVNGMGRLDVGNRSRLLRVVCILIVLAVLFLFKHITLASIFWAVWAPSWIAILLNLKVLRDADMLHWGDPKATLKLWFPYAMAGFVSSMLQVIYLRCDQLFMTIYMADGQRGLYANAVMFAELLLQVPNAISTVVFTNTSLQGQSNEDKLRACARLVRVGFAAVGVCGVLGIFLLPHIIYRVYGHEFVPSAQLFNLLLPGSLALAVAAPLQVFYQGKNRPWTIIGPQLISITVTAIGLFFALRAKSLNGIAITASANYLAYTLGLLWHIRRDYGMKAIGALFPHPGMIRTGWNRLREILRRRLSFVG